MSLIEWDESYSVNSDEMDKQHQKWVKMLNDLDNYMLNPPDKVHKNMAHKILKEMMAYATYHFKEEAEYMRKIAFPDFIEHVRSHKDFDSQIYDKYRNMLNGEIILNSELIRMIKDWLLDHILTEDMKYRNFVEDQKNK